MSEPKPLPQPPRKPNPSTQFLVFTAGVLLFCFFVMVAFLGRSLLVPLILAIVIWYLLNLLTKGFRSIPLPRGARVPSWLSLIFAFAAVAVAVWIVYSITASNAAAALRWFQGDAVEGNALVPSQIMAELRTATGMLPQWAQIELPSDDEIAASINAIFTDLQRFVGALWQTTRQAITQVTATASTAGLVILYMAFIFMEQGTFEKKARALTGSGENYSAWRKTVDDVTRKLNAYVIIKFFMSLLTATLSLLVFWLFDIQFALFWALLVFVLNFIPVIGSIIAWFAPMIFVVFGSFSLIEVVGIAILLLSVQQLVGSVIEPRVAGDALNLSPLIILLSLAFWGTLWGILGLFLAVPLTVMLTTILAQFQGTRWIAILLSRDGRLGPLGHSG